MTPAASSRRIDLALGAVALALVVQKVLHDLPLGLGPNNLWLCHLGNAAMGLGLLAARPVLARIGALWLLPGVPVWLLDALAQGSTTVPSVLSHVGGLVVAAWVVRRSPFRAADALWAWGGFLLAQLACRWWTPPSLNVNLAHAIHPGSERYFPNYGIYAVTIDAATLAVLYATCALLRTWQRVWQRRQPDRASWSPSR